MTTSSHHKCLICDSTNLRDLEKYADNYLTKCLDCSFVFCRKIPDKNELLEYYNDNYRRTSYFSPITVRRYQALLDRFEPYRKTNRILDVGCGYGFFLEIAREKGWEVYGLEISPEAVSECRKKGIETVETEIQNAPFDPESFDIVVSIEVIEHINTPREFVSGIHKFLRPGGIAYLTTPNFNSLLRYWLGKNYDIIEYPNHLCYYTPKTLRKLFAEHKLNTAHMMTTGVSMTRIRTSKGKSNQDYVSETSDDEIMRYRIEHNGGLRFLKNTANWFLNLFKVGDSLKARFTK